MTFKTEYAVDMTCDSCVNDVKSTLSQVEGIQKSEIDLEKKRVVVEGTVPPSKIVKLLRETGRTVIVRGSGASDGSHLGAAVCIFEEHNMNSKNQDYHPKGLARFVQVSEEHCLIDITVNNLPPGEHGVHIHEYGDVSEGPKSTGDHFNPTNETHGDHEKGHVGDLGNITVDENGWGDMIIESTRVKVWDIIGRSVVISNGKDDFGKGTNQQSAIDGNSGLGLICGIIARSAGLFENDKKVCACSGKTLWEEARTASV
ncbi:copper chaperone [Basidiobolus ranarum]|uniref:Superoxide dismutase 1 copper chaperone n=1 Tax=Basidiobolus ranarum TaxID=34480 RepID=A0ABR2WVY2_9FUNG